MARLTHTILAAAFTGALSMSAAAAGQPQALGLLAAADPVPMRCEVGTCRTVLSSFCLQQDHRSPSAADAYRMVRPDTVWLVGHDAASRRIDLPTTSLQFRPAPNTPRLRCCSLKPRLCVTYTKLTVGLSENVTRPYWRGRRLSTIESRRCGQGDGARVLRRVDTRRKAVDLAKCLINRLPRKVCLEPADRRTVWDQVLGSAQASRGNNMDE